MEQLKLDLFQAYYDARRNKRNTINQLRFELNYEHHLLTLYEELVNRTYTITKSIAFIVNHPVKREIFAADFRDRIIHHLIYNYINPVIDLQLIPSCYSCRKGKGTHYGIRQMAEFMQECSGHYTRNCYVLKLDIRGYFMAINKNLLWEKLLQMLELLTTEQIPGMDKESLLWLIDLVLWNDPTQSCIVKGKNTLGAYIKPHRIYIGNRTKKKFLQTLSLIQKQLVSKTPDKSEMATIRSSVNSYLGIMKHYKTYRIRKKLLLDRKNPLLILKYGYLKTIPYKLMVYKPKNSYTG